MEKEVEELLESKKKRNIAKNKPERFLYLAEAMPELLKSKRILVEQKLSEPMDFKRLEESKCNFVRVHIKI
jgi:hypothetical protein